MERTISDEEKIRRAIEISKRRNNNYRINNADKINANSKKEYKLFRKMFIQIIICLFVYSVFYLMSNNNYIFSNEIIDRTNSILNYDINFYGVYENAKNNINSFINKWKNQGKVVQNNENKQDEVQNVTENIEKAEENVSSTENAEKISKEENLSQMEKDAKYVKEKYKFIKPVSGKITSEFGAREILISGMTADHKGIDIATKQGTKIKATLDGQVEEASSNSQYGNFIKIKTDEVLTVYAHCKKLKVSKGNKVKKGDVIATVGSTGVATGPHLHFEIRLNNRYINPKLIIKW